jgi:cohesin complex subunit SA-1/2
MEVESRPSSSQADQTQSSPRSDRRKSGRVSKKPELLSQSYNDAEGPGGGKRKRAHGDDNEDAGEEDMSGSESEDTVDDEPDEEELRERKLAARRSSAKQSSRSKPLTKSRPSHSAKKAKVGDGTGGQLALRPATSGKQKASRPRKPKARPSLAAGETGLYGMSLSSGQPYAWLTVY